MRRALADLVQIVLPERVTDNGARRFAIVHELYHYLKRHPSPSPTMMCQPKWTRRGDDALHACEVGSNAFAGAVLLPEFLLRKRCEVSPVSLDVPWQIAREYDVSILTSAIRFAELTSERCAAVLSKRGNVVWAAASPTFTREIEKGKRIDRESVAWDYYATGKLDDREQPVPASAWFDTGASRRHRGALDLLARTRHRALAPVGTRVRGRAVGHAVAAGGVVVACAVCARNAARGTHARERQRDLRDVRAMRATGT